MPCRPEDASPRLLIGSRGESVWHYPGVFQSAEYVPDFAYLINRHLEAMGRRETMTTVPLMFTAGSIGVMNLTELAIECELPTIELKEEVEREPILKQMQGIHELVVTIRGKIDELIEGLDEDTQKKLAEAMAVEEEE